MSEPARIDGTVIPVDVYVDHDLGRFDKGPKVTVNCRGYSTYGQENPILELSMTLSQNVLGVALANAVKYGKRFRVIIVEMEN